MGSRSNKVCRDCNSTYIQLYFLNRVLSFSTTPISQNIDLLGTGRWCLLCGGLFRVLMPILLRVAEWYHGLFPIHPSSTNKGSVSFSCPTRGIAGREITHISPPINAGFNVIDISNPRQSIYCIYQPWYQPCYGITIREIKRIWWGSKIVGGRYQ